MKNYLNQAAVMLKTRYAKELWTHHWFWNKFDAMDPDDMPPFMNTFYWDHTSYRAVGIDEA